MDKDFILPKLINNKVSKIYQTRFPTLLLESFLIVQHLVNYKFS